LHFAVGRSTISFGKMSVGMRPGTVGILLIMAVAICGCTSNSVPPWAIAGAKSDATRTRVSQNAGRVQGSRSVSLGSTMIGSDSARSVGDHPTTGLSSSHEAKVYDPKSVTASDATNSIPSKSRYTGKAITEWDRHDQEENNRLKAAIVICHC